MDVIVIGTGIAGVIAALELADKGASVTVLTKEDDVLESNSRYAQGGIVYKGPGDSPELLAKDIEIATAGVANPEAIQVLAKEGPHAVDATLIDKYRIPFERNKNAFAVTGEAAHSVRRILYMGDATGEGIMRRLVEEAGKHPNITLLTKSIAVDLILEEYHTHDPLAVYKRKPRVLGVYVYKEDENRVVVMNSKAVIIATGGMGQIYMHTTNSRCATGDGYAMAYRAGARLINMEYTQFHPTTLYHRKANNFLISEAVRGEGAVLLTRDGEDFMQKYHPDGSLAPRDIVSQAIVNEMIERDDDYVLLDCTRLSRKMLNHRFPNIVRTCKAYGIDVATTPLYVVPAFHFSCGGIRVDLWGRTNVSCLYAVGETACTGLHGANRLASTSLLEGVTFGIRTAESVMRALSETELYKRSRIRKWIDKDLEKRIDPALINHDWRMLKSTMWNYVGVLRDDRRLRRAIHDLKNLLDEIGTFYRGTKLKRQLIEIHNAVQTGLIVARSAYRNKKSVGCHSRAD